MSERGARSHMVEHDLAPRGITDERVLTAMASVPREDFVPPEQVDSAYEDHPLAIGQGQTISQPYMVALMAQLADVRPGHTVLELGTGSGYGAAVLSQLAGHVITIERLPELAEQAARRLAGYPNVEVRVGDGSLGCADEAPFDAIVVTAAASEVPAHLTDQLAEGGHLVIPVGRDRSVQQLLRIDKRDGELHEHAMGAVAFVPLVTDQP